MVEVGRREPGQLPAQAASESRGLGSLPADRPCLFMVGNQKRGSGALRRGAYLWELSYGFQSSQSFAPRQARPRPVSRDSLPLVWPSASVTRVWSLLPQPDEALLFAAGFLVGVERTGTEAE